MDNTTLPMKPTGWFQVAWSDEIKPAEVHRMKYFGEQMVAWRAEDGTLTVMNAFCEHLGAHLGYGGRVVADRIVCPFHGWEWNGAGQNVCIPYQERPNRGRKIRTYPVAERNESVYIWHDVDQCEPYFDVPDLFSVFDDGSTVDDFYRAYPTASQHRERLRVHPQFLMENGVDAVHFKYVHRLPNIPRLSRCEFDGPVAATDFEIFLHGDQPGHDSTPDGGVQSRLFGLGVGLVKFWGIDDLRDCAAVTPVDDETSDVRFSLWLKRLPGDSGEQPPASLNRQLRMANNQFDADMEVLANQRYTASAALTQSEADGFGAVRKWAEQFYPESGATLRR